MAGQVEGWSIGENESASWAQSPGGCVDVTLTSEGLDVELAADGQQDTRTTTIPIAVLREVLRRVDAKGAR